MSSFVTSTVTESQVSKLFSELDSHKASLDIPSKLKIASKQLFSTMHSHLFSTNQLHQVLSRI